jgi:hypothetical protein
MLERLSARGESAGRAAAARRARALADGIAAEGHAGIMVEVVDAGLLLTGRDLRERLATEPGLRTVTERVR